MLPTFVTRMNMQVICKKNNMGGGVYKSQVPKCEIFDPFFYINKSYMGR